MEPLQSTTNNDITIRFKTCDDTGTLMRVDAQQSSFQHFIYTQLVANRYTCIIRVDLFPGYIW